MEPLPRRGFAITGLYGSCGLCPRRCGVNRLAGKRGYCGETAGLRIAAAGVHWGEEPPVTGAGGSGTIFITGCTLGCVFCQNWQISRAGMGAAVTEETFVQICRTLQERGAENINLVTGSHAVPAVAPGIRAARDRGLVVPVLWNSSAYEGDPALDLLEADVYLPDLKTLDPSVSGRFFKAPDYPGHAEKAVLRMIGRRGLRYGPSRRIGAGKAGPESPARVQTPRVLVSGVIIRHLVLPGYLDSTREVLRWFAEHGRGRALLSLMTQYTPSGGNDGEISKGPGMPRRGVDTGEYETLLRWLEEFDIGDGFYQELGSENTGWLPDFRRENPFPPELFLPVWHWERGFV